MRYIFLFGLFIATSVAFTSLAFPYTNAPPIFQTTPKKHPVTPTNYGTLNRPYKTNDWYTTLGIGDGTGSFTSLPYVLSATFGGLEVCAPKTETTKGGVSSDCSSSGLQLSAVEHLAGFTIDSFDDLSATITYKTIAVPECPGFSYFNGGYDLNGRNLFQTTGTVESCRAPCAANAQCDGFAWFNGVCYFKTGVTQSVLAFGRVSSTRVKSTNDTAVLNSKIRQVSATGGVNFPIVHGMPYVTGIYDTLIPRVLSESTIVSVNGVKQPSRVTGNTFQIQFDVGLPWIIFTSSDITVTFNANAIEATAPFSGWLRAAQVFTPSSVGPLTQYKSAIPVSGSVDFGIVDSDRGIGQIVFKWNTYPGATTPVLIFSLPHHQDILVAPQYTAVQTFTTKGNLIGVVGNQWTLQEPNLSQITWSAPHGIIDCSKKDQIFQQLANWEYYDPGPFAGVNASVYWYDKGIWKLARLVQIADEFGATDIATTMRNTLKSRIEPMLNAQVENPWVYEPTWGGIVTTDSLDSFWNDYGAGWYNDHHFHLGYFLYVSAIITKGDLQWGLKFKPRIMDLLRDITNPARDQWFPSTRHLDWFVGHSWAGGVFSGTRNQESSSEAVNAYYGTFMFGLAVGDAHIRDVGRMLLATEIRGAQKYWHMPSSSTVYLSPYKDNKMNGILWGNGANYGTFFSAAPQCIHEIQMLPYSPISELLLSPISYIQEQFEFLNKTRTPGWEDLICCNWAIIDPFSAWNYAFTVERLGEYGAGTSLPHNLYWAATRPTNGNGPKCNKLYPPTSCNGTCCPILIEVDSAGLQDGDYARFKRDYRIIFPKIGRGFNILTLSKSSRNPVSAGNFDTYGSPSASTEMVNFIAGIPSGDIVLVGIMDSAADPTPQVVSALSSVGAKQAASIAFRSSYGLIGVKGGAALSESVSAPGKGPVTLTHQFTC